MSESGVIDLDSAVQELLKNSLAVGGLCRGLHECAKALDRRVAVLCIVAENCDEKAYLTLVEALCREHSVPLIKFPDNKRLGQLAGLCKMDNTGQARKIVASSCVVVKDVGEVNPGWSYICDKYNIKPT